MVESNAHASHLSSLNHNNHKIFNRNNVPNQVQEVDIRNHIWWYGNNHNYRYNQSSDFVYQLTDEVYSGRQKSNTSQWYTVKKWCISHRE